MKSWLSITWAGLGSSWILKIPPSSIGILASSSSLRIPRGASRSQQLHSRKFRITLGGHLGQPSNSDLYSFSQSWRPHLGFRITYWSGVGFRVVQDVNTGAVKLRWCTALLEVPLVQMQKCRSTRDLLLKTHSRQWVRATSHTSQEPWPWTCESPKESVHRPSQLTFKIMYSRTCLN